MGGGIAPGRAHPRPADGYRQDGPGGISPAPDPRDPGSYDFHGLRHTFVSHLVQSGTPIKVVQALARHADPAMTLGVYTHVQVVDLARGLEGLPSLTTVHDHAEVVTGTYGHTLAHTLPAAPVSSGRDGADDTPEKPLKLQTRCVPSRQPARSTEAQKQKLLS